MRGSSRCKFEVNVYSDGASFVVEGNRLSVRLKNKLMFKLTIKWGFRVIAYLSETFIGQ